MSKAVVSTAATGLPTSRRTLLATLAGAGAALSLPKLAKAGEVAAISEPDPVFAAIKRYEETYAALAAAVKIDDGQGPEVDTTCSAYQDAFYDLAEVEPETLPGLRAMIAVLATSLGRGDDYEVGVAFPSIAAAAMRLLPSVGDAA